MKKKKIVVLALTAALLMAAHAVPTSAAEKEPVVTLQTGSVQTITPRWESTNVVVPSISISGKQIFASVYISPKKSTTSSVGTLYLEKNLEMGGHLLPHGRLMKLDRLVSPKLTTAQRVLHTAPE